jgi:uncharacterized protein YaeQ
MALTATIYKVALHIADMDRPYYGDHALTIARHPSETEERMMVRVLAFIRHAHEALSFGKGLSTEDEPALWQKDLTGAIDLWIDVGQPDEKSVRKACGRAKQVVIYTYGGRSADLWWEQCRATLGRSRNLTVLNVPADASRALAALARRDMDLQCTIQDGHVWINDGNDTAQIALQTRQAPC